MTRTTILLTALVALVLPDHARAQSLGTFRWQVQPYCNLVTVAVTQTGSTYRLEGTDDQCGAGRDQASVLGTAFPNPDGTIGFGMTIVTAPGGRPVHVDAEISIATLGGTWRDSAGATGTFVFTPGSGAGGSPRPPVPAPSVIPAAVTLAPAGSIVAAGAVGVGAVPASGPGSRMMWYPGKAASRAGQVDNDGWDELNIGSASVALGRSTVASGSYSTATGFETRASGWAGTATGWLTTASGDYSTAMGVATSATGTASAAMGSGTTATNEASTAMGFRSTADGVDSLAGGQFSLSRGFASLAFGRQAAAIGDYSVALGDKVTAGGRVSLAGGASSEAGGVGALAFGQLVFANGDGSVVLGSNAVAVSGAFGSFVFGDRSTSTQLFSLNPNEFVVRAAGGTTFLSNAAGDRGVQLAANGTDWTSLSDVNSKHLFRNLDGEDVLTRFARMPVTEWSYKGQDDVRHIGPTAQDFHAAFGLGQNPLRIGTLDSGGAALAGVKALEARTGAFRSEIETLRIQNAELRDLLAALRSDLDAVKAPRDR